jgi:hypothetical protein
MLDLLVVPPREFRVLAKWKAWRWVIAPIAEGGMTRVEDI